MPKDAINVGIKGTLLSASFGVVTASIVSALHKRNIGTFGPFAKASPLIYLYSMALLSDARWGCGDWDLVRGSIGWLRWAIAVFHDGG